MGSDGSFLMGQPELESGEFSLGVPLGACQLLAALAYDSCRADWTTRMTLLQGGGHVTLICIWHPLIFLMAAQQIGLGGQRWHGCKEEKEIILLRLHSE